MFDPNKVEIISDPAHWMYDERCTLEPSAEMIANVKAQGVIQPITVTKDRESGKTIVVAGRQRIKAARAANKQLIAEGQPPMMVPGTVRQGTVAAMQSAMVSENEARKEDTPLNRAKKMLRLRNMGHDDEFICLVFCCSKPTVAATLALLDSTDAVRSAVEGGEITITQAQKLGRLAPEQQRTKLKEVIAASTGKSGHAKAQAARAALDAGPRMRGKKEITAALKNAHGEAYSALEWVLGMSDQAPQPLTGGRANG